MKTFRKEDVVLEKIVGGGQALGTLADGRKVFVWGGLPGEKVEIQLTKSKSKMAEAVVTEVIEPSPERIAPQDPESYLSTSPWQIISDEAEARYKAQLIDEAFELHHTVLPEKTSVYSDGVRYGYRNKVEFSWYGDDEGLHLAFFRRGTHGKVPVEGTSLALSLIHISEPTRPYYISYAVFC
jgi:23S rRNA (uracil1939-C5)-methyltransferase